MSSLVMRVVLPTPPSLSCGLLRTFAYAHSGGRDAIGPRKVVLLENTKFVMSRLQLGVRRTGSEVHDLGSHLSGPDDKGRRLWLSELNGLCGSF